MAFDMTGTRRMDTCRFARLIAPSAALAAALAVHTRELLTPLGHAAVLDDPYIAAPVVKP